MARGYTKKDVEDLERPTPGPVPLTNFVRLQSGRSRKGNKNWRPLQPSELRGGADHEFEATGSSSPLDIPEFRSLQASQASSSPFTLPKASPFDAFTLQTNPTTTDNVGNVPLPSSDGSSNISPTDTRFNVVENYERLFGRLPDLIRLHEQTGNFDGQVVFIGHPNRDVSAHQWSSSSFQWVNVGQYSYSRHRVEGSLASSRGLKTTLAPNSVEYFKFAAEEREKDVKQFGRTKETSDSSAPPFLTEADRMASLSTASGSPRDFSPVVPRVNVPAEKLDPRSAANSASQNITRAHLEDPFVTPAKPPQLVVPASLNGNDPNADTTGSLDFGYQFPLNRNPASSSLMGRKTNVDLQLAYVQRRCEQFEQSDRLRRERETPSQLRDVGFGEEASSLFATPAARINSSQTQTPLSPEDVHKRQQLRDRLTELGDQESRSTQPIEKRVAIPDVPMLNTNIRALFPPGPTVANPYRGVSTLNANAAPYTRVSAAAPLFEDSQSGEPTVNAPLAAQLGFSDPDDARQNQTREIANGIGQQAPTRQNLTGPFFAESMPTAHDPTAALAFHVSQEEMLNKWFRDGQRPLRQQEYAKSLIATASTSDKGRRFGVIGEGTPKDQTRTKFENTSFLTRVLENLAEYAEESRTGERSYFTRSWKPAQPALCDMSPEGNQSFFENRPFNASKVQRPPPPSQQTTTRSTLAEIGVPSSSGARQLYSSSGW